MSLLAEREDFLGKLLRFLAGLFQRSTPVPGDLLVDQIALNGEILDYQPGISIGSFGASRSAAEIAVLSATTRYGRNE